MLGEIRGEVRFKEMLSFHTSLRIGGAADIFVVPQDIDDIRHALLFAEREQLPVAVVGGGNNLLVTDRGIRGVVLKLEGCLGRAEFHGEEAVAAAGFVWKNPPHEVAAKIIERVGLRGKRLNGAEISTKHANFIVNRGGASAADILALMELTRERVHSQLGITLETEIRVIGE